MQLDPDVCYRALVAHDARFDGVFFVGVSTTGIYCRPVCPARTPGRDRCTFFSNAAAAESAGYRPCLRCRPETAPGRSNVDAVHAAALAAVRRIEDGALVDQSLEDLAAELGLSSRHLRRVVKDRFGVTPVELAQTHRLLAAKRLLTDTALPVGEVAFASGFSSLRRFNDLLKRRYGLTPTAFRKSRRKTVRSAEVVCRLNYRPPFDWRATLDFLGARASGGVEAVVGDTYLRTADLRGHRGWLAVSPVPDKPSLRVSMSDSLAVVLPQVLRRVERLFDLSADPAVIASGIAPLADANPGLRVPGAFDGFEVAVRAILGQQVSVRGATAIAGKFTQAFGEPFETPYSELVRLSPQSEKIASLDVAQIAEIGVIRSRAKAIVELAKNVANREIVLAPGSDVPRTVEKLCAIPGIGPWTAEYIAMRCLMWPDAFPHTDLGIRKARAGCEDVCPDSWRPWRAYAAIHLWKSLEKPL